jgi:hypothetical protein
VFFDGSYLFSDMLFGSVILQNEIARNAVKIELGKQFLNSLLYRFFVPFKLNRGIRKKLDFELHHCCCLLNQALQKKEAVVCFG